MSKAFLMVLIRKNFWVSAEVLTFSSRYLAILAVHFERILAFAEAPFPNS